MRKCLFVSVIALAVVATTASAVDIKTFATKVGNQYAFTTQNGWNVSALSDDGKYIFADVGTKATAIDVATGTYLFQSSANTNARGFGVWDGNGGTYTWVAGLGYGSTGANPPQAYWQRGNPLSGLGRLRNAANLTNTVVQSAFNSVSMDMDTGDGWMVGHGMGTSAPNGVAWKITAGNVNTVIASWDQNMGTSTTNGGMNGCSNAGVGVGLTTYFGAVVADLNNNSIYSVADITPFAEADTNVNNGVAYSVSANATLGATNTGYVAGFFKASAWRNAFVADLSAGVSSNATNAAATRLFPVDGSYNGTGDETEAFDVSNNGIAVGYDYADGIRTAVVWLPGQVNAVTLESIMLETMTADVTRLVNCISITANANPNGNGQDVYTIAGQALMADATTRAFVATILPEPATLVFLTLGGLAMLRRRR